MTHEPFLYENSQFKMAKKAVIVLPEIYGLNKPIKEVADRFVSEFQMLGFGLDYFYQVTKTQNDIPYGNFETAINIMEQISAEDFLEIFNKSVAVILKEYPQIEEIIVCGFCFGGKLALLSGLNEKVKQIVAFYPGHSLVNFVEDKSVVQVLAKKRAGDLDLKILLLFGNQDPSITIKDGSEIEEMLLENKISLQKEIFEAGHAFFNSYRTNYVQLAAEKAWQKVAEFVNYEK